MLIQILKHQFFRQYKTPLNIIFYYIIAMNQLSKLRQVTRSHLQSKKKSLVVTSNVTPIVPHKKLSMGSQSVLNSIDSFLHHQKPKTFEKVSSRNRLKDANNISSNHKLFKPVFGRLGYFKQSQIEELPTKKKSIQVKIQTISKSSFTYQYIVGKGGFGKVWKVVAKKTGNEYALKQMLKALVLTKKSIDSVINQKKLLAAINNPFIVNIHYAFQDRQTLYLAMDLMPGGDLRYHLGSKKHFNEIQAKFFVACIVCGLEYIHSQNIIHRDIKPENLVFDSKGYIRITDFGIAKIKRQGNSSQTSGTPGYMAPQVICRQDHSYQADYFALGVIAYEFMFQKRPYLGCTRAQIRQQILARQIQVKPNQVPDGWTDQAMDFINKLIQRKPHARLGYGGVRQIKEHPWIRDIPWKKLYNKQLESPFIPNMKKSNFDQDAQITLDDQKQLELIQKNTVLLRKQQFQDVFKDYYYDQDKSKQTQDTEPFVNSFQEHFKANLQPQIKPQRIAKLSTGSIIAGRKSKQYKRI